MKGNSDIKVLAKFLYVLYIELSYFTSKNSWMVHLYNYSTGLQEIQKLHQNTK